MGLYKNILQPVDNITNEKFDTLGMPRPSISHQRINARICAIMNQDLNPQYEAIIEAEISGVNSKSPDICVWSLDKNGVPVEPVIALETTTQYKRNQTEEKILLMFSEYKTLKEAFMYIYDSGEWRFYQNGKKEYKDSSCSIFLENKFNTTFDFSRPLKNAVFSHLLPQRKRTKK